MEILPKFANQSLDAVYLTSVLHWLPDPLKAFVEFARVLKKDGGRLGFSTASKDHPHPGLLREEVLSKEPYRNCPGAGAGLSKLLSQSELEALLTASPFNDRNITLFPNPLLVESPEKLIIFMNASSFGNAFAHLGDKKLAAEKDTMVASEKYRTKEGILFETKQFVVSCRLS